MAVGVADEVEAGLVEADAADLQPSAPQGERRMEASTMGERSMGSSP